MAKAKVRLIDVAELAGVSKSTASQYLNGRFEFMSSKTRERIEAAVKELNYAPNPIARSLKTDTTKTIGVVVRDVTGHYTSRAIRGIDDYCKTSGYNVIIYNSDFDPEVEARSLKSLSELRVDGLIIASSGQNDALIADYESKGLPVVQFQLEHNERAKNIVLSDYYQAAYEATDYLIQLGHQRICFATQDFQDVKSRNERFLGYQAALAQHDITVDPALILYWQRDGGLQQTPQQLITASGATAIFSQHLAVTTDLLKAFEQAQLSIPEDVSLIGFDELPMAEFFKVPVTVVKQQPYQIGYQSAELLLKQVQDKTQTQQRITVGCELIKRQSCRQLG
ncbi:LacI family transcriptional regulator [Neiella marina]|uniref:LacI family transcriptional regulator n=1 Tax=Neiella holothuriorum TaxID=2870530 RepID=A0ABS7EBM0_9GAMM|nr:LacI family DNA-binding transcriptional regulator [Neiella holothuriorum]MBW8189733.1 LacI family transcriptional regulator [Neiella holothuriorum]